MRLVTLALLLLNAATGLAQVTENDVHILTRITDGVYTIRHRKAARMGALSGNTTVIVGDRDVLVVDSGSLPSVARDDLPVIKEWTNNKPIRYLVNTHWHGDHVWGNGVYRDAFPGLTIIAHNETSRLMQGYLPNFIRNNTAGSAAIKRLLASGKREDGMPLTDEEKAQLTADIPNADMRAGEFKTLVTQFPNLTFDHELTLDLGNREVQIKHLGRGNTSGDAIVYLPKEKVVVAGDLLVYPFPFLIGGFPTEWGRTLRQLTQLDPQTIVPGHGAVLFGNDGKNYANTIVDLLETVSSVVRKETYIVNNMPGQLDDVMEAVRKNPEIALLRQRFAGDDADRAASFDGALPQLIASAYREAWGN